MLFTKYIIAKFFSSPDASTADIMNAITSGDIFEADLSDDNIASLTIMGTVVLVYVISYLQTQIDQVKNMIMSAFNLKPENSLSEQLANDMETLTKATFNTIKTVGATIISGGEKKDKDTKKEETK